MSKTKNTFLTVLAAGVLLVGADFVASTTQIIPVANAESVRTTKKTRVMARPGETSRVLTRVNSGKTLKVLARKGRWIKVRANGRTGWITRTSAASTRNARTPVRRTRRRAFVEGRSTRRGFSGSAPGDRVGADAADDEEMLDDGEELIVEDEPKKKARKSRKKAKKSKKARRTAARDDFEDDFEDDFDDEEEEDSSSSERVVVVDVEETELMSKPSARASGVVVVESGQKLVVIEEKGSWIMVEDADGESGWIRSDEVKSTGFSYPKSLRQGWASLGYTTFGSIFASDDLMSELGNYKIATAAASLSVGGEYLHKYSDKYIIGGDARYTGTRASPGIRFVNAAGDAADIGFTRHEVTAGIAAGYNMQSAKGTVAYARAGYYYGKTAIDNVGDFEKNLAYLPSEILSGITVGARLDMPRMTDKIGVKVAVDALYPNGALQQTQGLEDGAVSSVFAAWAIGQVSYQWKSNLTLEGIYRYSYTKVDWTGAAEASMRPHNATVAARKDVGHTAMLGVGKKF